MTDSMLRLSPNYVTLLMHTDNDDRQTDRLDVEKTFYNRLGCQVIRQGTDSHRVNGANNSPV